VETHETAVLERAVLVGVVTPADRRSRVEEYLDELDLLAESAGANVVQRLTQERQHIDAAFFIGKGKAEELARLVEAEAITCAKPNIASRSL